jgi:hypothetical protein
LEDKVATKLVPWLGKNVTMVGRATLVKSVPTSIFIYYIIVLNILVEVLMKIDSIGRAFLWEARDRGKCKVNWEMVCKPKNCGGLQILYLTKFASALRMRWLWHEWNDEAKPWVSLGTLCTPLDKDLIVKATKFIIGYWKKTSFYEAPWLNRRRPKDIACLIYKGSKRKNCTVNKALDNDFWITQVNTQDGLSLDHTTTLCNLPTFGR